MRRKYGEDMQLVTFHLPKKYVEVLNRLVDEGYFASRAEAIRFAVTLLLKYCREVLEKEISRPWLG